MPQPVQTCRRSPRPGRRRFRHLTARATAGPAQPGEQIFSLPGHRPVVAALDDGVFAFPIGKAVVQIGHGQLEVVIDLLSAAAYTAVALNDLARQRIVGRDDAAVFLDGFLIDHLRIAQLARFARHFVFGAVYAYGRGHDEAARVQQADADFLGQLVSVDALGGVVDDIGYGSYVAADRGWFGV